MQPCLMSYSMECSGVEVANYSMECSGVEVAKSLDLGNDWEN
jgi:hypothetical protein